MRGATEFYPGLVPTSETSKLLAKWRELKRSVPGRRGKKPPHFFRRFGNLDTQYGSWIHPLVLQFESFFDIEVANRFRHTWIQSYWNHNLEYHFDPQTTRAQVLVCLQQGRGDLWYQTRRWDDWQGEPLPRKGSTDVPPDHHPLHMSPGDCLYNWGEACCDFRHGGWLSGGRTTLLIRWVAL